MLWQAWQAYAKRAGQYQTRTLLAIVYVIVVGPIALVARLTGAKLLDQGRDSSGGWLTRSARDHSLGAMRRQF
ncbi:MAG TPA: hypothetical protein VGO31_11755 [Microbacteriaceae bacterium]|nr:hypothetical protein [Microbacteriaceae bacterium]